MGESAPEAHPFQQTPQIPGDRDRIRWLPGDPTDLLADQAAELVEVGESHRRGSGSRQLEGPADPRPKTDLEIDLEAEPLPEKLDRARRRVVGPGGADEGVADQVRRHESEAVAVGLGFGQEEIAQVGEPTPPLRAG